MVAVAPRQAQLSVGEAAAARSSAAEDSPTGPGSIAVATADRLLEGVGLGGLGAEQASAMPTGLARMVELARALAMAPKVLLLDEPGSGLDDAESQALGELLTTLANGGMGVLLVEHDMELVMRICDYIYVLDFGDVIASGTPRRSEVTRWSRPPTWARSPTPRRTPLRSSSRSRDRRTPGPGGRRGRRRSKTTRWPRHE